MDKFIINDSTPFHTKQAVVSLIEAGFVAEKASISYNLKNGVAHLERDDKYPLTLDGLFLNVPITVKVYSVAAGFNGTEPNVLIDILRVAGFTFCEEDILTQKRADHNGLIHLIYTR